MPPRKPKAPKPKRQTTKAASDGLAPAAFVKGEVKAKPEGYVFGRPHVMVPDERTIEEIGSLAKIQPTLREAGAFFGVNHQTFQNFLDANKNAKDAWELGLASGVQALRRRQVEKALDGDTTMLIWLGKQYMEQKDKSDVNHGVQDSLAQFLGGIDGVAGRIPTAGT